MAVLADWQQAVQGKVTAAVQMLLFNIMQGGMLRS